MVLNASIAPCLRRRGDDEDNSQDSLTTIQDDSPIVYLNNAAQAPLETAVTQAGVDAIHRQPWELQHQVAVQAQQQVRTLFAQIIDTDAANIAIHPSTAFAITMSAENIFRLATINAARTAGTKASVSAPYKVLVIEDEFSSAVYPWQEIIRRSMGNFKLEIVPYPNEANMESWTEAILDRLNDSVLAACLTPLHWSDGAIIDLKRISSKCKQLNVRLVVDSTQASGIYPCSVADIQPDMLCCSVHKWLRGPSGASLVYIDPKWHHSWQPLDQHARGRDLSGGDNWNARQHCMDADGYPTTFFPDARKFDAGGKANPIYMPMLAAALRQVAAIDTTNAQAQLAAIMEPLLEWASLNQYTIPKQQCHHLVGLQPSHLSADQMIQIAEMIAQKAKIYIAVKCGGFRVSPYLKSTALEIQKLLDALEKYGGAVDKF